MNLNMLLLTVLSTAIFMGACGHSRSVPTSIGVFTVSELLGSWESNCNDLPNQHSVRFSVIFADDHKYQTTTTYFLNERCLPEDSSGPILETGAYALSPGTSRFINLDHILSTLTVTPANQKIEALYNGQSDAGARAPFCGIKTWQIGVATDIKGDPECLATYAQPPFSIMSRNSDGSLYFGFPGSSPKGATQDTRIQTLAEIPYFKKG